MRSSYYWMILMVFAFGILVNARKKKPRSCKGKNGQTYAIGKGYKEDCVTYTCSKSGKMKAKGRPCYKSFCKGKNGLMYEVGEGYSEKCISYTCSRMAASGNIMVLQYDMVATEVPGCLLSTTPLITTTPSGTEAANCMSCAYNDRIYQLGANVIIKDKCTILTCVGGNVGLHWDIEVLGASCCQFNGKLLKEDEQVQLYDGQVAKCCKGEMVSEINDIVVPKDGCLFGPKDSSKLYPLNSEIKDNCTYYKCQSGIDQELSDEFDLLVNYTWVPIKEDETCCPSTEGLVPNGWVGSDNYVEFSCTNGNMTVDFNTTQTHFDDDYPLSKEDMDINLDNYLNYCFTSQKDDLKWHENIQELITTTAPICNDPIPRTSNSTDSCCTFLNLVATDEEWASTNVYSGVFQGSWSATGVEVNGHPEYRSDNSEKYCLHMNVQRHWAINSCKAKYGGYVFSGDYSGCPEDVKTWKFVSQFGNHDMIHDKGMKMKCVKAEADVGGRTETIFYFHDGVCKKGNIHSTEKLLTENIFPDENKCIISCFDPCKQPPPPMQASRKSMSLEKNEECGKGGSSYYYNGRKCIKFRYDGCESNLNNFESEGLCQLKCMSSKLDTIQADEVTLEPTKTKEQTEFCSSYEQKVPNITNILSKFYSDVNIENSFYQAWQDLFQQTGTYGDNSHSKQLLPYIYVFSRRKLKWASASSKDCKQITVRIRYRCMKMPFSDTSTETFTDICDNLISEGIKRHFETTFNYGTEVKSINVVPTRVSLFNPFAKLYVISKNCYKGTSRSGLNMFLNVPIFIKACIEYFPLTNSDNTEGLSETLAHELGHDVLWTVPSTYLGGWRRSWTHKGTSTFFSQNTLSSAPSYPIPPGPVGGLDLMYYYNGNGDHNMLTNNNFLGEEDAQHMVEKSIFRKLGHCGGKRCGPFLFGGMCQAGLKCRWFRCVECTSDSDCNSNQYCFGKNNPLLCNECRAKKPDGSWCSRDAELGHPNAECINFCHGFRCTECEHDSQCPANEYCKYRLLPGIQNKCRSKKSDGSWCTRESRDAECQNYCDGLRCAECEHKKLTIIAPMENTAKIRIFLSSKITARVSATGGVGTTVTALDLPVIIASGIRNANEMRILL